MIDKRILNAVPESKKYIFLTVLLKWLSLSFHILIIFSAAEIIRTRGGNISLPLIFICLGLFCSFFCTFFISISEFKSSCNVKKTLRAKIYQKLLELGNEYQEKTETAKIVQLAVDGVEQLEVWFGFYAPQLFYSMAAALTLFFVISFLNLKIALVLLICVPLIPLSIVAVQKIAKKILSKYWTQYANLADNFLENLQGLSTLQIYQADEFKQKKMNEEAEHFRKVTMKVLSMQLNSIIIMDIVAYGGAGLGICAAVSSFFSGALPLEKCFACILLSADFFIPLRRLGSYFHTAMNGTTAANRIFDFMGVSCLPAGRAIRCSAVAPLAASRQRLRAASIPNAVYVLKNVSYTFSGGNSKRKVLSDINLSIKKGEFVVFTGKSGSGKSTAAKILCGINSSYEGLAIFEGEEIRTFPREELYKKCIYITHRDWIFMGTVRSCLLEGNPAASELEMWKILEKVQLADFVREQGGLDMKIQENAANLSGGQKQRLSIARALIHKSEILIFDEAASNIDVESERAILALLRGLRRTRTIIMISHRTENSADADQIYRFENGKVFPEIYNAEGSK